MVPSGTLFARGSAGPRRFGVGGTEQERVIGEAVSGDYFSALKVKAFAGRLLDPKDDETPQPVIVLSHSFWSRRFNADTSLSGKSSNTKKCRSASSGSHRRDFAAWMRGALQTFGFP